MSVNTHDLVLFQIESLLEQAFDAVKSEDWDDQAVSQIFKDVKETMSGLGGDFRDLTIGTFWDMAALTDLDQDTMNFLNAQSYRL